MQARPAATSLAALVLLFAVATGHAASGPITFHGLLHTPLGDAVLTLEPDGKFGTLTISNIGSSGLDGVCIDLGASEAYAFAVSGEVIPSASSFPEVTIAFRKDSGDAALGIMQLTTLADGRLELHSDFADVGATTHTIEGYLDGVLVAEVTGHPNAEPDGLLNASIAGVRFEVIKHSAVEPLTGPAGGAAADFILDDVFSPGWILGAPGELTLPNGETVMVDLIDVRPEDATAEPETIGAIDITAANLDSIIITDETVGRIDHFLAYNAVFGPQFTPRTVTLSDQFEEGRFDVRRPFALLNPVDKNDEGVFDIETHLVNYQITPSAGEPPHEVVKEITVDNQFGSIQVDTVRPVALFVPTAKAHEPPLPPPPDADAHLVDHYKCYQTVITPGTPPFQALRVTLHDQFDQPKLYGVLRPTMLCNPVDKNDEGIKNPDDHLMCYSVRPTVGEPAHSPVQGIMNNQFQPQRFRTIRERELCVPSVKLLSDGS